MVTRTTNRRGSGSASLDRLILDAIDASGANGITAWEIEAKLRSDVGISVHQSVTGNLRHLVENGDAVATGMSRFVGGRCREVYVGARHHSVQQHGEARIRPRRNRQTVDAGRSEALRRRLGNARPNTATRQIRELLRGRPEGLTCREIEVELDMSHQTVSARLSELKQSGMIADTGRRRRGPQQWKLQTVWALAESPAARHPTLFG
jgi:hypothetical protein